MPDIPTGGRFVELSSDDQNALAARIATILGIGEPSSRYIPLVQNVWEQTRNLEDFGLKEFELLLESAARTAKRRLGWRPWTTSFQEAIDDGIQGCVWNQQMATGPLILKVPVQRPQPKSADIPAETAGVEKPTTAASTQKRKGPVWGQGSVRLGPRWTTGTKDAEYYNRAFLDFSDEDDKDKK